MKKETTSPPALDSESREERAWKALADPTRREILDLLRLEPRTTGTLADRFAMSRYGVMKHLRVLEEAGLVLVRRKGRDRWNHLNPVPIQEIHRRWILPFETPGADSLLRLRNLAERQERGNTMSHTANDASLTSLDIQLEIPINASTAAVWKALTSDIAAWWPKDFYVGPSPRGFVLEQKVGGRVYEDWGEDQGLLWATVLVIQKESKLQWAGDLSADFGGPARSITTYTLKPQEDGTTVLQFRDTPYGKLSSGAAGNLTEGWKFLLEGSLKPFVEEGKKPVRPASVEKAQA